MQKVSNHGTMPETVNIGIDEIGHMQAPGSPADGQCGFTHSAPLATPSISSVHLNPGEARTLLVHVSKTGPAGYHTITVDYTIAGTGNVKVSQGVATVVGVTYPGKTSTNSAPCIAIAKTPEPSGPNVGAAAGGAGALLVATLMIALGARSIKRRRAARKSAMQS
jgi:hypothetical protein